jgi:hypothetical protein
VNWGRIILFSLGLFLGTHLTRFLFGLGYDVWLTYLGHDGVNIARALLVGIVVFLLLVRLALAERERVLAHFGAVLVLASLLESAWIQYVSALGRGWIFGLVEMLLAAVLAYFVSLLLVMREKNRQR